MLLHTTIINTKTTHTCLPTKERKERKKMSKFNAFEYLGLSLNPDGSLNRGYVTPKTDPNPEPSSGNPTVSKDVTLNPEDQTWMRLFRPTKLPSNDNNIARLPIFIYFHNGGWLFHSPADVGVHKACEQLATDIPSIVVSVAYRPAPENRLPAQYYDARDAVMWVREQMTDEAEGEQWLREYGDPSRCYLYGHDCGGNIVFNAAVMVAEVDLEPLRIAGVIMNQPMFSGEKRTGSELRFATDQTLPLPVLDMMWSLALPKETDRDHRYSNPVVSGPHLDMVKKLGKCLVIGYGGDIMVDRQQELVTMLAKRGVQVEARFDPVGFHNIDMVDRARANAVINIIREFIS